MKCLNLKWESKMINDDSCELSGVANSYHNFFKRTIKKQLKKHLRNKI